MDCSNDSVFESTSRQINTSADPKSNGIAKQKSRNPSQLSDGVPAVCRICHSGENSCPFSSGEPLISACYCRGSTGLYHRCCLERWLSMSNKDTCEICKYQYLVERKPRPWTEFITDPGVDSIRRNLITDLVCLCILTPFGVVSVFLCFNGAFNIGNWTTELLAVSGLMSLAMFLVLTYIVWFLVALRYHYRVWKDWRVQNQRVCLVSTKSAAEIIQMETDCNCNFVQPLQTTRRLSSAGTVYSSPWPDLMGTMPSTFQSTPLAANAFIYTVDATTNWQTDV